MSPDVFDSDPKDRKRRFLRGLNVILSKEAFNVLEHLVDGYVSADILEVFKHAEDKDVAIRDALEVSDGELRQRLASIYFLEFTPEEIDKMGREGMTPGEFTEKYCPVIYERGRVDLNTRDRCLKYGLNGLRWCNVTEGPCSCGAWH